MGILEDNRKPSEIANRWLRAKVPQLMEAIGIRATGAVSVSIDIMCPEYHTGKGGHSAPGDPPYKETGNLQAGLHHVESVSADEASTTIISERAEGYPDVPSELEFGAPYRNLLPRPYMRPVMNQGERILRESLNIFDVGATYAASG